MDIPTASYFKLLHTRAEGERNIKGEIEGEEKGMDSGEGV